MSSDVVQAIFTDNLGTLPTVIVAHFLKFFLNATERVAETGVGPGTAWTISDAVG